MMVDKYIVQGQPFSGSTVLEVALLGANMFGAYKSGTYVGNDIADFGGYLKRSWNARNATNTAKVDILNGKEPFIKMNLQFFASDGGGATKPSQVHHYATNKSKTYTPQLEEITKKYNLGLDDVWNKDLLPHQGRHPNAYHEYILESIKQFDDVAQGDKKVFLKLFDNLKNNVKSNPDMLYKDYWK